MSNFYNDVIQCDPRFTSTAQIRDPALLEPGFRAKVATIMTRAHDAGTPLMIIETYRSQARQEMLFQQKATQLRTVGVHHYGLAVDFAKLIKGEPSWTGPWDFLGELAASQGCTWGGSWTFKDYGHVQGITVAEQSGLFAGTWYPE